jgi:hypothetical protein
LFVSFIYNSTALAFTMSLTENSAVENESTEDPKTHDPRDELSLPNSTNNQSDSIDPTPESNVEPEMKLSKRGKYSTPCFAFHFLRFLRSYFLTEN